MLPGISPSAKTRAKLVARYGTDCVKLVRARRKRSGHASLQYIRFRNRFVLPATIGGKTMRDRILKFIDYFNRTMAKPYKWTYAGRPLNV